MNKLFFCMLSLAFCSYSCSNYLTLDEQGVAFSKTQIAPTVFSRVGRSTPKLDTLPNGAIVERLSDSLWVLEEDILLDRKGVERIGAVPDRSGALSNIDSYWDRCEVYYMYHPDFLPDTFAVRAAMNTISASTGVVFCPKKPWINDYVLFKRNYSGSFSNLGKIGGCQEINIHVYAPVGTIMHEILHALGFIHEHSRPDRDDYIIINESNIKPNMMHNFQKYSSSYAQTFYLPFDFNSVMMYGSYSSNMSIIQSIPLITKLDGTPFYQQRDSLTSYDIKGIKAIYGPPFHRLEIEVNGVLQNDVSGNTEIYEDSRSAYIRFYADRACTIPQQLDFERKIRIKETRTKCFNFSTPEIFVREFDVYVQNGMSEYHISDYTNFQWYFMSNMYQQDERDYIISPTHF